MNIKISEKLSNLPKIDYRILKPIQGNLKDLNEKNLNKLKKSIKEFGFVVPLFVWRKGDDMYIIDGHQRHRLLMLENITPYELPYVEIEANDEKEAKKKLLVISSQYGTITQDGFDEFAFDIEQDWLKATIQFDALKYYELNIEEIIEDEFEVQPNNEPITKPGDVYELGDLRHRFQCGDSTDAEVVKKTLNGAEPILMVTDPPYGVNYDPDWRNHAFRSDGTPIGARAIGKVINDHQIDWSAAYSLFKGNIVYVWHSGLYAKQVQEQLENLGFEIVAQLIWAKNGHVIGRGDYHFQHEPCWYAVRKNKNHNWQGSRSETSLWQIDRNKKNETGHSTQKPVECMARPIRNNTTVGQQVYDPFLGSGTTIIAGEQLKRQVFGNEISPEYCDLIVARWIKFKQRELDLNEIRITRNGNELSNSEKILFLNINNYTEKNSDAKQ